MLPIYVAYFAGGASPTHKPTTRSSVVNAFGFVLGFTLVFVVLGAFAGTVGSFISQNSIVFNIICGIIVIVFGLNFMGVLNIGFLNRTAKLGTDITPSAFGSALVFGLIFAIGWTPCVGTFLGSALILAAQQGTALEGIVMLICFSIGLGIPFVLAAVLIRQLEGVLNAIKRHYRTVNMVCGIFLVIIGVLMATGLLGQFLSLLSF